MLTRFLFLSQWWCILTTWCIKQLQGSKMAVHCNQLLVIWQSQQWQSDRWRNEKTEWKGFVYMIIF